MIIATYRDAKLSKTTSTATCSSIAQNGCEETVASPANTATTTQYSQIVAKLPPFPQTCLSVFTSSSSSSSVTPIKQQQASSVLNGANGSTTRFAGAASRQHPLGKVKAILRINSTHQSSEEQQQQQQQQQQQRPFLQIDTCAHQLTLFDPTLLSSYERNQRPSAPKLFAFDAILDSRQLEHSHELSKASLPELINAVMNANDAVLFALGKTGTHETMLGSEGLMVYAICWLFNALKSSKRRFAIKCSAAQVNSTEIIDLLAKHNSAWSASKSKCILNSNSVLSTLREMSCNGVKRAAHCLDIAVRQMKSNTSTDANSLLFTLHVYQYKMISTPNGKNKVVGGRSKLHLFDISPLTKNLTNILLAIFNGQKHIPNKESKITIVLKECLSSKLVWCSIVANITNCGLNYIDTLTTCQFVTRVHRSRMLHCSTNKKLNRRLLYSNNQCNELFKSESDSVNNEDDTDTTANCYTSSSEHSVDTVIFCGKPLTTSLLSQTQIKSIASPQRSVHQKLNATAAHHCISTSSQHQKQSHEQHSNKVCDIKKCDKQMCDNGTSPLHKTLTSTPMSDELWIDGPKKGKRKLPTHWSKELWVDGPNASQTNQSHLCVHDVEYMDKQQRIQDWIQQHTKHIWSDFPSDQQSTNCDQTHQTHCSSLKRCTKSPPANHVCHQHSPHTQHQQIKVNSVCHNKPPETNDACCQTETTEGVTSQAAAAVAAATVSESEWSCDEETMRSWSEDEFSFSDQQHHFDLERAALSDCCDNDVCYCSHDEDFNDAQSEPLTEPPKQLKLEQFLKQLITITAPNVTHKHQNDNHCCHHENVTIKSNAKLRHSDGASSGNLTDWDLPRPELIRRTCSKEDIEKTNAVITVSTPTKIHDETQKNHNPVLPTSPRVNRIITGSSASHNISASPTKSRKQQQHKRNTTSTTTSGHGTTSEGECSSVAKKSSGSSSTQMPAHQLVIQSQPASSGYDSTIHDDESDRELPVPPSQPQIINQTIKVNTKVKLRSKSSRKKRAENDEKRNSVSSEKCSFLCCKFMDFY